MPYPAAPDLRMAYDRDGTQGMMLNLSSMTVAGALFAPASLLAINDEDNTDAAAWNVLYGTVPQSSRLATCLIFPEFRDLTAYMICGVYSGTSLLMEKSSDTTNGIDGVWTSLGVFVNTSFTVTSFRTPTAAAHAGIKALRWSSLTAPSGGQTHTNSAVHLYGKAAAGQNPNRLRLWHPTLDQEVTGSYFDWGDIARSTSQDRPFRLRNNSASLTANTITVSTDAPTEASPAPVAGQHLLERASNPGFTATVVVATLSPGATSEIITLRRATPVNASTSLWWARVLASAASWV